MPEDVTNTTTNAPEPEQINLDHLPEAEREPVRRFAGAIRPYLTDMRKMHDETKNTLEKLRGLQEKGEVPDAEHIRKLEDTVDALEKNQRALELQGMQAAYPVANDDAALARSFEGTFIADMDGLRSAISNQSREASGSKQRSLDSALFASGGELNPDAADAFINFLVSQTVTLSRATIRRLMSNTGYVDFINIAPRKMRKATEATAPGALADSITFDRRTMNTVEVIWPEDITRTLLEDNIERGGLELTIARLLGTQFSNDLNDLAWNGDEADADPFLSINDGWLKFWGADANVHDIDATGLTSPDIILNDALQAVPYNFLGRTDWEYTTSVNFAQQYAEQFSKRETAMGDAVFMNGLPALRYFGIPIVAEPHFRNGSDLILTPRMNFYFGIQRDIEIDGEYIIRRRVVEYTITARKDFEYITGDAVVKVANVPVF